MNLKVHYSSLTPEWSTPQSVFDKLDKEFHFTLDPCATDENHKCAKYYTEKENGLEKTWFKENVFMNPPYGREIYRWMQKAWWSRKSANIVVCLVPSRTDTKWWHDFAMEADEIRFIKGRLKFGESKQGAPFPSAIVIFRKRK